MQTVVVGLLLVTVVVRAGSYSAHSMMQKDRMRVTARKTSMIGLLATWNVHVLSDYLSVDSRRTANAAEGI